MENDLDVSNSLGNRFAIAKITVNKLEPSIQMGKILQRTCRKVVQNPHGMSFFDKSRRDMRTNKTRAARDQIRCHYDFSLNKFQTEKLSAPRTPQYLVAVLDETQ